MMPRLGFGAFLAPHHPIGENPTLQFRRDLEFVEHLDELGYDEFWCGEHHSSGWEMIASPEMFLAAAGERTKRIKLGTGVISLPYHHPYNVAQRMVQLDHMTGGRAIFGSGPGALPSDAHTLGIDPMVQRDRQDEAIGVIRRLFKGERVTPEERLVHAAGRGPAAAAAAGGHAVRRRLADQPLGHDAGRQVRHRHHLDRLDVERGPAVAADAVGLRRGAAAKKHGTTVDRKNWRVLLSWHIAETREKAREEAQATACCAGTTNTSPAPCSARARRRSTSPDEAVDKTAFVDGAAATIGTPDDLVKMIKSVLRQVAAASARWSASCTTGPIPRTPCAAGTWWRATSSPRSTAMSTKLRESQKFLIDNRDVFDRAGAGGHGQDHGEQGRRRGAQGHQFAALRRGIGLRAEDAGQAGGGVSEPPPIWRCRRRRCRAARHPRSLPAARHVRQKGCRAGRECLSTDPWHDADH